MSTHDLSPSIERCPHDSENPYTMVLNSIIRDENISPNCRWLIIYLLSNKDNWEIKFSQIQNHVKDFIGRDKARSLIDEAVEAGYMKKENYMKDNLKRTKYFVSEKPKFKKFLRCTEIQEAETRCTEDQCGKEETSKEKIYKETITTKQAASPVVVSFSKEQQEKLDIMNPYSLPSKILNEFVRFDYEHIESAIKAYEQQLKKKRLSKGALISAIREGWKPNLSEKDLLKEEQDKMDDENERKELNKYFIIEACKKYKDLFSSDFNVYINHEKFTVNFKNRSEDVYFTDEKCFDKLIEFMNEHLS